MGALVEISQGVTGKGHCRLRDLIPDAVGALLGSVIVCSGIKYAGGHTLVRLLCGSGDGHPTSELGRQIVTPRQQRRP